MLRSAASSLLIAMMTLTAMWGGCVSCPKFFMLPGADTSKDCCDQDGRCKRKPEQTQETRKECRKLPLEVQDSGAHLPALAAAEPIPAVEPVTFVTITAGCEEVLPLDHSPPDIQVLHATFLI